MSKLLVIMPVYNTSEYLEQAIESVLQQKDVDLDLCIIDDKSTDNSFEIISEYSDIDNIIIFQNKKNRGTYFSRNRGLELLESRDYTYFTVHDSDDVSLSDRYFKMIEMFKNNDIKVLTSSYLRIPEKYITGDGIDTSKGILRPASDGGNGIAMYHIDIFNGIGYQDDIRFGADTDYFWRAQAWCKQNNEKLGLFELPIYFARERSGNLKSLHKNRGSYVNKIRSELSNMISENNFYRPKFD